MPTIDRDGVAIHYEIHGSPSEGLPVLLTHGYSSSRAMWAPNLGAIGSRRQVVAWDIRGHGESASPTDPSLYSEDASVADMAAVLDACAIERAVIGGLSLGGYLSLAFCLRHEARTAALLLCDTGPGFKRDAARATWNQLAEAYATAFERQGLGALGSSPEVGRERQDALGLTLAARGLLTRHDARVINALPDIAVPTLVIVGELDTPFLAAAEYMAAKMPGADHVVIAGAGHAANIDRPEAFNEAVVRWLDQVD